MRLARVFVQEYPGRQVGSIHDIIDSDNHPGSILSGIIAEIEAYAVYRMNRIKQFYTERAQILGG